jgi:AraC-like DNA-binding protein
MELELKKIKLVTDLRGVIDGFAAKHAAINVAKGESPESLFAAYEELEKTVKNADIESFLKIDRKVHLQIVELSGVYGLKDVWQRISGYMTDFNLETLIHCWPDLNVLLEAHADIIDAITEGNSELSEMLAKSHLDSAWYRLEDEEYGYALPNDPVAKASSYLAFHLNEQVTLEFLAKYIAKVSVGHLSRLFKAKYNIGFTSHVKELRLKKAASMLRNDNTQISKIAFLVGYKDASRFSEHFRKKFGVTPSVYRRQHKTRNHNGA